MKLEIMGPSSVQSIDLSVLLMLCLLCCSRLLQISNKHNLEREQGGRETCTMCSENGVDVKNLGPKDCLVDWK